MTKSQIIKDLANGQSSLKTALKRTKVLMSDFEDKRAISWIDHELTGYAPSDQLPDYRLRRGMLMGSYFKGSMAAHMSWSNVSIPLGDMPKEEQDMLLAVEFREGVESLQAMLDAANKKDNFVGKQIPADLFPFLAKYNNDPYMMITRAYVQLSQACIQNILDCVENKLLDTLLTLEKVFGNLDELDISLKDQGMFDGGIIEKIVFNIYDDHSISVGEKARIKNSVLQEALDH